MPPPAYFVTSISGGMDCQSYRLLSLSCFYHPHVTWLGKMLATIYIPTRTKLYSELYGALYIHPNILGAKRWKPSSLLLTHPGLGPWPGTI